MNISKKVRRVNNFEKKIITNTFNQISPKFNELLEEDKFSMYITLNKEPEKQQISIYLIHRKLNYLEQLINFADIHSFGLYFGFIKKGKFFLSLEGADFLYKGNFISKKDELIVNKEGEKAILYGNNVLKKMILHFPLEAKSESLIMILNELEELIGIGFTKIKGDDFNKYFPEDLITVNLIDKGYYLRREN
ncbi:MAG: hypothetical protein ACFFBH_00565 [Promethearchaeota archaeon]